MNQSQGQYIRSDAQRAIPLQPHIRTNPSYSRVESTNDMETAFENSHKVQFQNVNGIMMLSLRSDWAYLSS